MGTDCVVGAERFNKFFSDLDRRKSLLTSITQFHKTLTDHFSSLQHSLSQKSQNLDSQINSFESRTKQTLDSLQSRENSIPERESSAAARIDEQREAAISDIEKSAAAGEEEEEEMSLSEKLRMYCRRMDSKALVKLLLAKRKESVVVRTEIAAAVVAESVDAMRLVLDAVEEFVEMKVEGKSGMADRRWACGMLIQAAVPVAEPGSVCVATSLREKAASVLERWKGVMGGGESGGVGAGEATMFLHMVVGFGLKDNFEEEYLKKFVVEFAARRDMAKLAVALGFGDKMKDIIDGLVKNGKEIEAVYFISESGLTEQFPPVALLKTHLKNIKKNANSISKSGNFSTTAVDEANNSELNATKAIIKCVEDHKLESQFQMDSLRKRITALEKAKVDRKKNAASTTKPSNKRSHGGSGRGGSGAPSYRPPKAGRFSNASPSFRHRNPPPQLHQVAATRYSAPYNYASHSAAAYGPPYGGAHSQSPATALPQQYPYAPQDIGATGTRAGVSYGGPGAYAGQTNYSAYDYTAAAGPAYPTYPQ